MAAKTQLSPTSALPMGRYGSFAGKSATAGGFDVVPVLLPRRVRRWRSDKFRRRRGK